MKSIFELGEHHPGTIPVLHVGLMNDNCQNQSQRVYNNMTFAPLDLFAGIVTANPFLSVVFTL